METTLKLKKQKYLRYILLQNHSINLEEYNKHLLLKQTGLKIPILKSIYSRGQM